VPYPKAHLVYDGKTIPGVVHNDLEVRSGFGALAHVPDYNVDYFEVGMTLAARSGVPAERDNRNSHGGHRDQKTGLVDPIGSTLLARAICARIPTLADAPQPHPKHST